MLKLWHFTDPHLHLRENPEELDTRPNVTALLHSEAILDACLAAFLAEPDCDTLLISGDLTQHGHPLELLEMLRKLRDVQAAGKRVIVITASHDLKTGGDEYASKLRRMFAAFGPSDAIASFDDGQAFVVPLTQGVRLLCIHDHDRTSPPPWLDWAIEQIIAAKAAGEFIFGMTHLPSLPPTPLYPLLSKDGQIPGGGATVRELTNAGLHFMLTGHAHFHNIAGVVTPEGEPYWDVNTSALIGYPGKFRELQIEEGHVHITSRDIPHIPAFGEFTAREYLKETLETVWRNIFYGMEHDFDLFCESIDRMIPPAPFVKYKKYIRIAGAFFNHSLTLGRLGRLLLCKRKIPKGVRKLLLRDVIIELMGSIASGEEHYGPDTDIGKAFMAYGRRLQFIGTKRGIADFSAWWLSLVYDETPDDEVEIQLYDCI